MFQLARQQQGIAFPYSLPYYYCLLCVFTGKEVRYAHAQGAAGVLGTFTLATLFRQEKDQCKID